MDIQGGRRGPLAAALAVAFSLVFVALPNPLRVPKSEPNEVAELAPVPGDEQVAAPSNIGNLGQATTPTLGSVPGPPPPPGGREVPIDKECVGVPPRQTEDLLSPPCVPYYDGDNGGATWRGVTTSDVRAVLYNDFGVEGEMNEEWEQQGPLSDQASITKTIKAHVQYFNRRFQTYGRTVRVVATTPSGQDPAARNKDGLRDAFKWNPFAAAYFGDNAQEYLLAMAEFHVPSFGLTFDVPRSGYEEGAPYIWSFVSDQETQTEWSASFICRVLLGRGGPDDRRRLPARLSPDDALARQERRIGLIWHTGAVGNIFDSMSAMLKDGVRDECGYRFDAEATYSGGNNAGTNVAPGIIAQMQADDITTIVCYCLRNAAVPAMQSAATTAEYHPEWYWDSASKMDRPAWQKQNGADGQASFGTTYFWRQPSLREQMHYQMYARATKDGSVPNLAQNFTIYHLMLNLFTAVQAAGPTLNPETIQRGMFTFRFLEPDNAWLPSGGYGHDTPGPYTFIDSAMAWWWDPDARAPGAQAADGCQKVMNGGHRYAGPEGVAAVIAPRWPLGDSALARASRASDEDACSADNRQQQGTQFGPIF